MKSQLIGKNSDSGKDWGQEEKGATGHEFQQAPVDGEGQGSLACCSPCGHKESDTT